MRRKGMMTFEDLGDYRNCVVLCRHCHFHFDRTSNTSFVFLPTDLQYFVDYEERDFAHRLKSFRETGEMKRRTFPDETEYELHGRQSGQLIGPDDGLCRGGLYNRYILGDMFARTMMIGLRTLGTKTSFPFIFPGGPQRWHGAPMAAINRGFVVLGSADRRLPKYEAQILFKLQGLYSRTLDEESDRESTNQNTPRDGEAYNIAGQDRESTGHRPAQARPLPAPEQQTHDTQSGMPDISSAMRGAKYNDSAIDVKSEVPTALKGKRKTPQDSPGLDSSLSLRSRGRSKRRRGFTDTWYFGPSSTSTDKMYLRISDSTTPEGLLALK